MRRKPEWRQRDLSEVQFTGKMAKRRLLSKYVWPFRSQEWARAGLFGCRGLPLRVTYIIYLYYIPNKSLYLGCIVFIFVLGVYPPPSFVVHTWSLIQHMHSLFSFPDQKPRSQAYTWWRQLMRLVWTTTKIRTEKPGRLAVAISSLEVPSKCDSADRSPTWAEAEIRR